MARFLVAEPRNWVTIATIGRGPPLNVVAVTAGDDQLWLRPSPGLWRMRRAEVGTVTVVLAALFGLVFWAAAGPLAGLISVVVTLAVGVTFSWSLRRRFRAWRYQARHED